MSYTLILTEKPSASEKIAYALAEDSVKKVNKSGASYYRIRRSGKEIVVAPAVGHLFILVQENQSKNWEYPVFNVKWQPTYLDKKNTWSKKYFSNIQSLVKNADEFISATDFDTEGSVIAYNIFRFIFNANDGKRMKFSTLTRQDLIEAYDNASKHLDFPQIEAGLTRHQLDYYFGINLTRALTLALESVGGYWTLSTGRVQGPTLKILEERQKEIKSFVPAPYWELEIKCAINGQKITASHARDKFWKKEEALNIQQSCKGKNGTVSDVEKKEQIIQSPYPFDLTTLQRIAYAQFGYSPKTTLDIAQSLYEHALISYPRTSSQMLPPRIGYKSILSNLSEQKEYSELAKQLLERKFLKPKEGDKTDPAHPAIFPTGVKPRVLNAYQKKVYDLIVKRFFAVFGDPAIREQTRVDIDVNKEKFVAHGIRTLKENWIELYRPYAKFKDELLPEIKKGDIADVKNISLIEKETQPPSRYTQASILKEMENLGLGTKATRAQILQTLYDRSYIEEKSISVTELGEAVVNALENHCKEIVSVELTRKFEDDMESVELGKKKREEVLAAAELHLTSLLKNFRQNQKNIGLQILNAVKKFEAVEHDIGKCYKCGGELKIIHSRRTKKRFVGCSGYPKCNVSFPLPQHGHINAVKQTCKNCGLHYVSLKQTGKRPWRFCVKCGYEKYKEELERKNNSLNPQNANNK